MSVGIFESLAADQSDARLASRRALVLSRDRIDARLGKFLGASRSSNEFAARFDLVAEDFVGIVRVSANEVGHDDPDALVETLHDHYAKDWIQKAVKKPGDLHKKLDVPEGEKIPESKIENAEETGDKNLKEKAQFAENVKGLGKKKKSKKNKKKNKDNKPPWLNDDDADDSLEFAAKTADAVPLAQAEARIVEALSRKDYNLLAGAIKSAPIDNHEEVAGHFADHLADTNERFDRDRFVKASTPEGTTTESSVHTADDKPCPYCDGGKTDNGECKACNGTGKKDRDELGSPKGNKNGLFASVHTADEGNTGLSGPSPKMDKQRWTPKSVKPIDVPSERHPTVQKDITEVMPKENEGPPGDIGKIDEINALTTTETLPTGKGLDDAGFATGGEDFGPNTKTWGTDGREADPVRSDALGA